MAKESVNEFEKKLQSVTDSDPRQDDFLSFCNTFTSCSDCPIYAYESNPSCIERWWKDAVDSMLRDAGFTRSAPAMEIIGIDREIKIRYVKGSKVVDIFNMSVSKSYIVLIKRNRDWKAIHSMQELKEFIDMKID